MTGLRFALEAVCLSRTIRTRLRKKQTKKSVLRKIIFTRERDRERVGSQEFRKDSDITHLAETFFLNMFLEGNTFTLVNQPVLLLFSDH